MTPFFERLKAVRIYSGKKQREVAEFLGVNIRTYQYYEEGKNEPAIPVLIRLADYFDVSLDVLLGRDEWTP